MKNLRLIHGIFAIAAVSLFAACGGEEETHEIVDVEDTDSSDLEVADGPAVEYAVPTPNELFEIVKLEGGEEQVGLVSPLDKRENHITTKDKALNFGVYSADLAYMSCFGIGTEFLMYFKAIEEMGEELGIEGAFDEDLMGRIESNEGDTDSLFAISNDTYYDSYLYLEENDKGPELCLIMAGGYIESLYIICNLVTTYSDDDPIVEKIGDQRLVLENLLEFIGEYGDNADVSSIIEDLIGLQQVFETSMEFEDSGTSIDNNDGMIIIGGGGSYTMTEQALVDITAKVKELRSNIIK